MPWSYTNQVLPISSQILWNEVVQLQQSNGSGSKGPLAQNLLPFELPYVVKIYNATYPCGSDTQEVFTFRHLPYPDQPYTQELSSNAQCPLKCHKTLSFTVQEPFCEIHGFAGYFTAELYQDVFYSIEPSAHTPGMHSWFPMYFPVKTPFTAQKGQKITISIWRNCSETAVWYEWAMAVEGEAGEGLIFQTFIHNSKGRGYSIGK